MELAPNPHYSGVGVDRMRAKLIGNKQTNKQTHLLTHTQTFNLILVHCTDYGNNICLQLETSSKLCTDEVQMDCELL